ncbi:DUF411 domain-containing protein [Pseudogulbenkiania sp. MAI-1]|uniref:DUF411 domain-containing protein n=1 Tax=Pseudogulbenkiania sp. MAI-1 TaxID=990370 RepID=UPI00045E6480|nr:DUF411 domain-containing protein [Pseudogulbenkiania sp. MAI-1]
MKNLKRLATIGALLLSGHALAAQGTLYKDPNCGCCTAWADHLKAKGITLQTEPSRELASVRSRLGVPSDLGACHTARIDGYTFEGHVPADLVQKVLRDKPKNLAGLAVPGMPPGSPGMEGMGKVAYKVYAFDKAGKRFVYAER